jgi:hypothetical protein
MHAAHALRASGADANDAQIKRTKPAQTALEACAKIRMMHG